MCQSLGFLYVASSYLLVTAGGGYTVTALGTGSQGQLAGEMRSGAMSLESVSRAAATLLSPCLLRGHNLTFLILAEAQWLAFSPGASTRY